MKTVLFLTQTVTPLGGVQTRLDRLSRLLPAHGWTVKVGLAWGRFHDPFEFRRHHPGLDTVLLDGRNGTPEARHLAIRKAISRTSPDVVVPVTLVDPFDVMQELKRRAKSPRLVFGLYEVNPAIIADARRYAGVIDRAVGVNALTSKALEVIAGLGERVRLVRTGVLPASRPTRISTSGPLRLGYCGRLDPGKRPGDLVAICRELDLRGVPYRLTVVGLGTLREKTREELETWVARGAVRFEEPTDVAGLYERVYPELDALLLFSAAEGTPNVLIEAMVHGVVPVIASYQGCRLDGLVDERTTGALFDPGDLSRAADWLSSFHRDRELLRKRSEGARTMVKGRYEIARMVEEWAGVLDLACEGPAAVRGVPARRDASGRLDRYLGARIGEWVRAASGRRAKHANASEWPYSSPWPPEVLGEIDERLREVERGARESGESGRIGVREGGESFEAAAAHGV